ncbi:MAG: radical SAM protein [Sedimentisphaerales bacterium]
MSMVATLKNQDETRAAVRKNHHFPLVTNSLCPECLTVIEARIDQDGECVYMDKACPKHGAFRELISPDPEFFSLMLERDQATLRGLTKPLAGKQKPCPEGCGLCDQHRGVPMMLNIDLTNRCNLRCPVCFANADATGWVVEPTIDQVRRMLDAACEVDVVGPVCFQFTGGEPTVHPDFLEALREVKKRDFTQVQVATNGLRFGQDPELAFAAAEAGLNIAYLQFDGMSDQVYKKTRGRPLLEIKLKAIVNLFAAGIRTMLVPTIVKGVNDHQIGSIVQFAVHNTDKISGISWQPVSFTGRIDHQERLKQRFTVADLATEIERQTGLVDKYRDWYPFSFVDPFARLLETITGQPQTRLSCNPICGVGTYLIVDSKEHDVVPVPAFLDVEPLMDKMSQLSEDLEKRRIFRKLTVVRALREMEHYFHQDRAPSGWTFETCVDFMMDFADFRKRFSDNKARQKKVVGTSHRPLLMASMHFQDAYNYQIERARRCVVQYAALDGRLYPFCTYNCGPSHRQRVERQFAVPLAQYRAARAKARRFSKTRAEHNVEASTAR